ncbi:MAG TPA: ATP-binding protein, partial [Planctomycetaceae bacterium]|nr:ATP-binding protein [Planctomycetaceae bacterium]
MPGLDAARPILDVLAQPVVVTDLKATILYWNQSATDLYGFRADEALGHCLHSLLECPPFEFGRDSVDALTGKRCSTGDRYATTRQLEGRSRSGRALTVLMTMSPLGRKNGEPIALIGTAVDITAAANDHRGLKETVALVEEKSARIEAEAELARVSGEADRLRLDAEADRITAESEKKEAERVRLEAEADRLTAEGEKKEAERVRLDAEADRLTAEGEKRVAEGLLLEDAAHREQLEAQLHRSQRLESLGQLAGGIAHDFNNLLAVILNYASFVAEELSAATANGSAAQWEEPLKDVRQIQLAAERASLLTHQLLSFARREVVQARALSLNSAITRMEQILRRTIGEQIELVITLAPSLPLILADPGQIEQIVLNLAINARDAMPSGGTLSIDTAVIETLESETPTTGVPPGLYVRFRVSDTGIGMSAEVRDRAFEPFYTTKPSGEGSGLGLATVYGIVLQSGGYSRIYSDEGIGTSISILLPVSEDEPVGDAGDGSLRHELPLGTETILVVDDEQALREVTGRMLTRSGYTVLTASSGAQAIELARSHAGPIHLVLTDVIMPKMQGPTVAKEVRKVRRDIRVLFMSGHAQPVLQAEDVLGTDFLLLEKPFDQAIL